MSINMPYGVLGVSFGEIGLMGLESHGVRGSEDFHIPPFYHKILGNFY
jgi:hypothetical protein